MDEHAPDPQRHRRRRRRATAVQGPPPPAPSAAAQTPPPVPVQASNGKDERRKPRRKSGDRQARGDDPRGDLAGTVRSQVGVSGALRARDVNRPTEEDLAAAEAQLVIVRRNWRPEDGAGTPRRKG